MAFGSDLLDDTTFRMVRLISPVPTDLSRWIRVTMVRRFIEGRLHREYRTVEALLSRVRDNGALSSAIRLLANVKRIDLLCHAVAALTLGASRVVSPVEAVVLAVVSYLLSPLSAYLFRSTRAQGQKLAVVNWKLENPILKRLFVRPEPEFMESNFPRYSQSGFYSSAEC